MLLTNEGVMEEVNKLAQYLSDKIPGVIDFALSVVLALVVFFVGAKLIKWVRKIVKRSLERAKVDKGVTQFVDSMLKFALYALLIFSIGQKFGLDTASVAALLASCGVAVGLALQGSLSNFAGGVLILVLKPFVVGDYIIENADKMEGTVAEITIFYTKLLTPDNKAIMLPNGTLSNSSIVNVTAMKKRRLDLRFGVAYDSDIKEVKEILERVAIGDEAILKDEPTNVFVSELMDSYVEMGARGWVKTDDYWTAKWRITENVKLEFDKAGISIPFPQMEITMKSN